MIRSHISKGLKDWDEILPTISMALHSMVNRSTGFSANMLMLGRETTQPLDIMLGQCDFQKSGRSEWLKDLIGSLSIAHDLARRNVGQAQLTQKKDYDLRVIEYHYNVGDVVYVRDSSTKVGVSAKLRSPWKGPFIVERARPPLYELERGKKRFIIHHDRLKPCRDAELPNW